jgi:hypothetical protein
MLTKKEDIILDPRIKRSFAGVRGRVKAAVAAQPRSVSLSQALAQTRQFRKATETRKLTGENTGRQTGSGNG